MQDASANPKTGAHRPKVLFISADPVGSEMAGLGIRYAELARALSGRASVTIAHGGAEEHAPGEAGSDVRTVAYRPHAPGSLRALIAEADAVVCHPQWPLVTRWLRRSRARVIVDLYDPETLETLELLAGRPLPIRRQLTATTLDRLHDALRSGHHFMCASEKQRDLWLGAMLALRLIDPAIYDRDPSLRSVIDLVPFGVPETPPSPGDGMGPRQTIRGLGEGEEIVLWGGGIWRWLDAETAIRAVVDLAERRPSVRLLFMGGDSRHPAARQSAETARALARELGALGSIVHFHDSWVPYAERAAWLTEADCAVSCHRDHLETRFAFRTRILDCFWAGLPVVCTQGDDLADRISREGLGETCPPEDRRALALALERVLDRGRAAYAPAMRSAAAESEWPRAARRLIDWIESPAPLVRPGDSPGVLRPPLAQQLRAGAYRLAGRHLLARRSARGA